MTPSLDRRAFVRLFGTGVGAVGLGQVLASCAADAEPVASPTATAPATEAPSVAATGARPRPTTTTSYGPNGTHFPRATPWPGDTAATEIEVECTWAAIAAAIRELGYPEVAEGVVIRVQPGELVGQGSRSGSTPVLDSLGRTDWERNILICPRDGYGTVTLGGEGFRLEQCARLSLFGFVSEVGFVLTQCADIEIGWSRVATANITRGGTTLRMFELVCGFRRDPEDTAAVRPTDNYLMTDIERHGCLFGPSVKPADSDAHCDTIQAEGTGAGTFGPLLTRDSVDYGSSNAAELLHTQVTRATYEHCLILADRLPWEVYPLESGDYDGTPNAFSGGCQDVRLSDSVVVGAIGRLGYTHVTNTTLNYQPQPTQHPRESGQWEVDAASGTWNREQILALQPTDGSDAALSELWRW